MNKILEIGTGPKDRWTPDTVGIDLIDFGQKYVGDYLEYKFKTKFDAIIAHHVVEHLPDTVKFFDKVCDDLKPGGIIDIRVPILPHEFAFVDPTHVKFIPSVNFFQYFTDKSPAGHCYSKKPFEIISSDNDRHDWELHVSMSLLR